MHEERESRWRSWMVAAQAADSASYEKLLHELVPNVRKFVRWRLFDPGAVEDVVQNVFLSMHRARHTYRPERAFSPWLHAIARNAAIDHVRARGRRALRPRAQRSLLAAACGRLEAGVRPRLRGRRQCARRHRADLNRARRVAPCHGRGPLTTHRFRGGNPPCWTRRPAVPS